jgi:hypothetical protein
MASISTEVKHIQLRNTSLRPMALYGSWVMGMTAGHVWRWTEPNPAKALHVRWRAPEGLRPARTRRWSPDSAGRVPLITRAGSPCTLDWVICSGRRIRQVGTRLDQHALTSKRVSVTSVLTVRASGVTIGGGSLVWHLRRPLRAPTADGYQPARGATGVYRDVLHLRE